MTLERNYRSTQPMLDAANAVAAQAVARLPEAPARRPPRRRAARRRPRARRGRPGRGGLHAVLEAASRARDLRDQAVLARTSHDSDLLELELTRRRIPFHKYGGLRYLEAAHVKDFVALLRLADNGADDVAWFRVLQLVEGSGQRPPRDRRETATGTSGAGANGRRERHGRRERAAMALAFARDEVGDGRLAAVPDRLAAWPLAREAIPAQARAGADGVIEALLAARAERRPGPRAEILRAVLEPLVRARYPDGAVRVVDLEQLVAAAHQASDPRHFVAELVLDPPSSSADIAQPPHLDEDYLTLSTIHSRQGPGVGQRARPRGLRRELPGVHVGGNERVDRRGAAAAVRRDDARARGLTLTCRSGTTTDHSGPTTRTDTASRRGS